MSHDDLTALHAGTPDIVSASRVLRYLRTQESEAARLLSSRVVADPLTRTSWAFGARLLDNPVTDNADTVTLTTLSGAVLVLHTADGDRTLSVNDAVGRPLWSQNAQGTVSAITYELEDVAGRPLTLTEQAEGEASRVREQYTYALFSDTQLKDRNLAGTLTELRNNVGISTPLCVSITGQDLQSQQRLLKPESGLPNWSVTTENETEEALTTYANYDATDAALSTTNAAKATYLNIYDICGNVIQAWLRYSQKESRQETQVLVIRDCVCRADGVVLSQTAGNGVTETYTYDRRTQHLIRHTTARPESHSSGVLLISDLHYTYDPTGKILTLEDKGADPQWHNNQQATGLRIYTYDTLYRLVTATGRERMAVSHAQPTRSAYSTGGSVWSPYSEEYSYDDGDNLVLIRHSGGAGNRTRELTVSAGSNRAMVIDHSQTPETGFFTGGLQKELTDGRRLQWYFDGQLHQVSPITRAGEEQDDTEVYSYANGGTRVRKVQTVKVAGSTQTTVTIFAGGCEVRKRMLSGSAVAQKHIVITERGGVRMVQDRLAGESYLRFNFGDHFGSSGGETDSQGLLMSREEYAPYGGTVGLDETEVEVSSLMQRTYRYSGKERDASGLIYYGWRYYQPEIGRWLSADPGGVIDGINLFRMCRNDPINMKDDNGLAPIKIRDYGFVQSKYGFGDKDVIWANDVVGKALRLFNTQGKTARDDAWQSIADNATTGAKRGGAEYATNDLVQDLWDITKKIAAEPPDAGPSRQPIISPAQSSELDEQQGLGILLFYSSNAGARFINGHARNARLKTPTSFPGLDNNTIAEARTGLLAAAGEGKTVLSAYKNAPAFKRGTEYLKSLGSESKSIGGAMRSALDIAGKGESQDDTLYRGTRMTSERIASLRSDLASGKMYRAPHFLSATPDKKEAKNFYGDKYHERDFLRSTEPVLMTLFWPGAIKSISISEQEHIIPPGKELKAFGDDFYKYDGGVHKFNLIGK